MTYSVDIYDKNGKVVEQVSLNPEKFNEDLVNNDLIHEFYLLQTSNARKNIAKTK
jgi:ribosomal protein L4